MGAIDESISGKAGFDAVSEISAVLPGDDNPKVDAMEATISGLALSLSIIADRSFISKLSLLESTSVMA